MRSIYQTTCRHIICTGEPIKLTRKLVTVGCIESLHSVRHECYAGLRYILYIYASHLRYRVVVVMKDKCRHGKTKSQKPRL